MIQVTSSLTGKKGMEHIEKLEHLVPPTSHLFNSTVQNCAPQYNIRARHVMLDHIRKFSLRAFLLFILTFSLILALGANWYRACKATQRNVDELIRLSVETEKKGKRQRTIVIVYYDNDLVWLEDEKRLAPTFPSLDPEPESIFSWLNDYAGVELFESPTAIEFMVVGYDESKITDEMVERVNQLNSVKQIWIRDCSGSLTYESTRELIRKRFPNATPASLEWLPPFGNPIP